MLELYQAYTRFRGMMELTKSLTACRASCGMEA